MDSWGPPGHNHGQVVLIWRNSSVHLKTLTLEQWKVTTGTLTLTLGILFWKHCCSFHWSVETSDWSFVYKIKSFYFVQNLLTDPCFIVFQWQPLSLIVWVCVLSHCFCAPVCVCVLAGSQLITCPYNGKIVQAQDGVFLVKAAERQTVLCAPPVVQSWNCFHWGLPSSCFGLGFFSSFQHTSNDKWT